MLCEGGPVAEVDAESYVGAAANVAGLQELGYFVGAFAEDSTLSGYPEFHGDTTKPAW